MERNVDFSIPHPQASVSHSCMRFYAGIAAGIKEGSVIDRDRERRRKCVCVCVRVRGHFFKLFRFFLVPMTLRIVSQNTSHKF